MGSALEVFEGLVGMQVSEKDLFRQSEGAVELVAGIIDAGTKPGIHLFDHFDIEGHGKGFRLLNWESKIGFVAGR